MEEELVLDEETNTEEVFEPIIEDEVVEEVVEALPEPEPIKVYIMVDAENKVVAINSEIFIDDLTDWVFLDEGHGDHYAHAQGHYLPKALTDEEGRFTYEYVGGELKEA